MLTLDGGFLIMKTKTKLTLFTALLGIIVGIVSIFKLGSETRTTNDEDTFI